jgi:GT2 family glycosyltransferase
VRRCLDCLIRQTPRPDQIIVVDASRDDRTRAVVEDFSGAIYLRNELGYGHMTHSRNIGLMRASGDIIAFLDDDAYAHDGWSEHLLAAYSDPQIGAVGGRALNNFPHEATFGVDQIGQIQPNGLLTGNFAADPGRVIPVAHIIGCNMSFRREILCRLGGFREDYPGTEVREETDMSLRVTQLGSRIVFAPGAVVDHVAAPQVRGKRFDSRYAYYHKRNSLQLLIRNFGFSSPVPTYLVKTLTDLVRDLVVPIGRAIAQTGAVTAGAVVGAVRGTVALLRFGRDPVLRDPQAEQIRAALAQRAQDKPAPACATSDTRS